CSKLLGCSLFRRSSPEEDRVRRPRPYVAQLPPFIEPVAKRGPEEVVDERILMPLRLFALEHEDRLAACEVDGEPRESSRLQVERRFGGNKLLCLELGSLVQVEDDQNLFHRSAVPAIQP